MVRSHQLQSANYDVEYFQRAGVCRLCWAPGAARDLITALPETVHTSGLPENASSCDKQSSETTDAVTRSDSKKIKDLIAKILSCLDIDVRSDVQLPKKICENCTKTVNKFHKYKTSCQRADRRLKEIYSEKAVKLEQGLLSAEIKTEQIQESFSDTCNGCDSNDSIDDEPLFNLRSKRSDDTGLEDNTFQNCEGNTPPEDVSVNLNLEHLQNTTEPKFKSEHHPKSSRQARSKTYCNICHTEFGEQFTDHNRSAHGVDERGYNCFGCEKMFPSRKSRLCHETKFCKELKEGYRCARCGHLLPGRRAYEAHQREHRAGRAPPAAPARCAPCGRAFASRANLLQHSAVHADRRNFVCEICGRVFNRRDYLLKHIHTHTGQKLYVCPHCGFRATQKSSLTVHIRKHTGERPYACDVCGQKCVSSSNLLAHRRRHDGHKNFECAICGKKFGYKLSLEEHMASTHERLRVHACELCGATYSRQRGLRRHARVKHGANYEGCGATERDESRSCRLSNLEKQEGYAKDLNMEQRKTIAKDVDSSGVQERFVSDASAERLNEQGLLKDLNSERACEGTVKNSNIERENNKDTQHINELNNLTDEPQSARAVQQGNFKGITGDAPTRSVSLESERASEDCRPNQWIFLGTMLGLTEPVKPVNK